jgi:hypothetical protein
MIPEPEDERDRGDVCSVCGARVAADTDRGFAFGTENVLCFGCAELRGGRFDARRDVWDPPPDLSDVPDEAYGAAPHEIRRGR